MTNCYSPESRTLWVHWGRNGGGPRFLAELVEGDLSNQMSSAISYNPDAEIAGRFEKLQIPQFAVPTYNSHLGVILGMPRLVWNSVRLRRWIKAQRVVRVVGVMESVYQSIAIPLLLPNSVEYVACIHDGRSHPGEANVLQRIGRFLELRRADFVVTFSQAVTDILQEGVSKPILTAEHPPFDLENRAKRPRQLPDRPVVGLFGRLQKYKGIDLLLDAGKKLKSEGLEFTIRIVGRGSEERLRDSETGKLAEWDNRWIPEEEVATVVQQFDIMALPYTEASQSGPVTLAMAQAIPCVATPVGALPTQVEGFGLVAEGVDSESLATILRKLLTNPHLYEELSRSALQKIAKVTSWQSLALSIRAFSGIE